MLRPRATDTEAEEQMTKAQKVRKAVIPAAGLGTRFLPATKAQPKEMLPLLDKPAIQYVVEEAVHVGITDILIITGRGKRSIEDHFDRSIELEHFLESKGKFDELKQVREISDMATIHYIRQRDPLGLGHAVAVAEDHVGDEPFAVLLGDDIMAESNPLLSEMLRVHERYGRSVLAAMQVFRDEISLYGCIEPEFVEEDRLARVLSIVEKPDPDAAPSNLAAIGRYVLTPEIFGAIRQLEPGVGGEIQLTDAINLLAQEQAVYAHVFEGGRFDVGNKLDYVKATIELAIDREDVGKDLRRWLADLVERKKLL
jgi:UTP--glucose-1-phosphate uridylyltransferase